MVLSLKITMNHSNEEDWHSSCLGPGTVWIMVLQSTGERKSFFLLDVIEFLQMHGKLPIMNATLIGHFVGTQYLSLERENM